MKRVFILRHAKSSWSNPNLKDYDRPLKKRGKEDAKLIGEFLKKSQIKIDKIISSGAKRAKKTAKKVAKELGVEKIFIDDSLYMCGVEDILKVIQNSDDSLSSILIVSHNLAVSDFIYNFIPESKFEWIPTAGLVGLEFEVESFREIDFSKSLKPLFYVTPKMLKEIIS